MEQLRAFNFVSLRLIAITLLTIGCGAADPPINQMQFGAALEASLTKARSMTSGEGMGPSEPTCPSLPEVSEDKYLPALGASAAIRYKGRVYTAVGGYTDTTRTERVTPRTMFHIGSTTKVFTAVSILKLVQDGKLSLQDTVSKWFPQYAFADQVTVEHLLTHSSGLGQYFKNPNIDLFKNYLPIELVELSAEMPRNFEPGTSNSYSNVNTILMGLIVEQVTGDRFVTHLRSTILEPFGLTRTFLDGDEVIPNGVAADTIWNGSELVETLPYSTTTTWAAGGLVSTPTDQVRWLDAVRGGRILNRAMLQEMGTQRVEPSCGNLQFFGGAESFGYHIFISPTKQGTMYWHGGTYFGTSTMVATIPEANLSLAVTLNSRLPHSQKVAITMALFNSLGLGEFF